MSAVSSNASGDGGKGKKGGGPCAYHACGSKDHSYQSCPQLNSLPDEKKARVINAIKNRKKGGKGGKAGKGGKGGNKGQHHKQHGKGKGNFMKSQEWKQTKQLLGALVKNVQASSKGKRRQDRHFYYNDCQPR